LWEFIDAPLRTFSSGMVARLGFAVATDAQPDILLLDEVLSVGDSSFQRKSFDRILSFRASGATIIFVSHNLDAVKSLCERAIWLERGHIAADGPASVVGDEYQYGAVSAGRLSPEQRWGTRRIEITEVRIKNSHGAEQVFFATGDALTLEMDYCAHQPIAAATFGMAIHRHDGLHITGPNTDFSGFSLPMLEGCGTVTFTIPHLSLLEGLYHISVAARTPSDSEMFDYHDRCYPFRIANTKGCRERYGLMTVSGVWSHTKPQG
jgi:lipopolysaccharide transport system ATP-binding protein